MVVHVRITKSIACEVILTLVDGKIYLQGSSTWFCAANYVNRLKYQIFGIPWHGKDETLRVHESEEAS
jgi:hypothetical protein